VHLFFVSVILVRGLWWVLFHSSCCVIAVHLFTTLHSRSCAERISCLPPVYCWIATDVQGVVPHQSCHISGVGDVVRCTTLIVSRLRHDATGLASRRRAFSGNGSWNVGMVSWLECFWPIRPRGGLVLHIGFGPRGGRCFAIELNSILTSRPSVRRKYRR